MPVRLFLESQDHQHDLVRELRLVELSTEVRSADAEVCRRLAGLIAEIHTRWDEVRSSTRAQMLAALERGEERAPLDVPVLPGMAAALRRWLVTMAEADEFARRERLLTVPAPAQVAALRAWYVEAVTAAVERTPTAL